MITWRPLPDETSLLFSPVGLLLVDDLTGRPPVGRIDAALELRDGPAWRPVDRAATISASGVLLYPGLGRSTDVTQPPVRYRVRIESPHYRPLYRVTADGIEFDAPPYNDANPPAAITRFPVRALLLPAAAYPFAPFTPVIRGVVRDAAGDPVPDVLVQEGLRERTLSDARGAFSLALRWVAPSTPTVITADDQRNGRAGSINITLPAALESSQTIVVT